MLCHIWDMHIMPLTHKAPTCVCQLQQLSQELFETHMGIRQEDIQKLLSMSYHDRLMQTGNCLEGAHLPPRGFYFVKPIRASQLQAHSNTKLACIKVCDWLPFWRSVLKQPAINHPSGDLDLAMSSSDGKPADSGNQSGELELP